MGSKPAAKEFPTGRLFIRRPDTKPVNQPRHIQLSLFEPIRIEIVGVGSSLSESISGNLDLVHSLSPDQFEEFICERLYAMGLEPKRVGGIFRGDGGIDVVFWPRVWTAFPFLGAAQIKHHRNPRTTEGPDTVREFVGSISGRPFSAGIVVTNTSFSPGAEWFARQHSGLVRLRGFDDIRRWVQNNFSGEEEWRELPSFIELAPGVTIRIR